MRIEMRPDDRWEQVVGDQVDACGNGPEATATASRAAARALGYHRPFDDEWAAQVAQDAEDLTALFAAAAGDGEAVVTKIVA
jgi:hypothetical protein